MTCRSPEATLPPADAGLAAPGAEPERRATWAVLALLSAGALVWLASPGGTAILTAAID